MLEEKKRDLRMEERGWWLIIFFYDAPNILYMRYGNGDNSYLARKMGVWLSLYTILKCVYKEGT